MTNKELNRDIKRLYKNVQLAKKKTSEEYFNLIENDYRKEFIRLYGADNRAEILTKDSLLKMYRLNLSYQYVELYRFYINAEPKF